MRGLGDSLLFGMSDRLCLCQLGPSGEALVDESDQRGVRSERGIASLGSRRRRACQHSRTIAHRSRITKAPPGSRTEQGSREISLASRPRSIATTAAVPDRCAVHPAALRGWENRHTEIALARKMCVSRIEPQRRHLPTRMAGPLHAQAHEPDEPSRICCGWYRVSVGSKQRSTCASASDGESRSRS